MSIACCSKGASTDLNTGSDRRKHSKELFTSCCIEVAACADSDCARASTCQAGAVRQPRSCNASWWALIDQQYGFVDCKSCSAVCVSRCRPLTAVARAASFAQKFARLSSAVLARTVKTFLVSVHDAANHQFILDAGLGNCCGCHRVISYSCGRLFNIRLCSRQQLEHPEGTRNSRWQFHSIRGELLSGSARGCLHHNATHACMLAGHICVFCETSSVHLFCSSTGRMQPNSCTYNTVAIVSTDILSGLTLSQANQCLKAEFKREKRVLQVAA